MKYMLMMLYRSRQRVHGTFYPEEEENKKRKGPISTVHVRCVQRIYHINRRVRFASRSRAFWSYTIHHSTAASCLDLMHEDDLVAS